jgi:hypothetical protein
MATASLPSIFSFFRTTSKISGAGLDSSTSSDEVAWSTRWVMLAISRYLFSSSFFADEAMATRMPAARARCSRSGTAENGRINDRYLLLNRSLRHLSSSSPWSFSSAALRKVGMSLSPPLPI